MLVLMRVLVHIGATIKVSVRNHGQVVCNLERQNDEPITKALRRLEKSLTKATGDVFDLQLVDSHGSVLEGRADDAFRQSVEIRDTSRSFAVVVNPPRLTKLECYGRPLVGVPCVAVSPGAVIRWQGVHEGPSFTPTEPGPLKVEALLRDPDPGLLPSEARLELDLDVVRADPLAWKRANFDRTGQLRVCSYNVLADAYKRWGPTSCKTSVVGELLLLDADIICLQEVDAGLVPIFWEPQLKDYECLFQAKSGEGREGVALFYKPHLRLLKTKRLHLYTDDPVFANVNSVAVLASFQHGDRRIAVANAHFYFHYHADELRRRQMQLLLDAMRHLDGAPLIVGDLNSSPDSPAIALASEAALVSAGCDPTRPTHRVRGFCDTIDHILYDPQDFCVRGALPLPTLEDVPVLPSSDFPSDHLAICCDLNFA